MATKSELDRSIRRAAETFDEFIGIAMSGAILKAEDEHSRTGSDKFVEQLQMIRRYTIGVLNGLCPVEAERLIHTPVMPEAGLLDYEMPADAQSNPTEPGRSLGTEELIPASSDVPGLGSWCELGQVVNQN